MFTKVNLKEALNEIRERDQREGERLISTVNDWFKADWEKDQEVLAAIKAGATSGELPEANGLCASRIFTYSQIRELCVNYRLRFLSTRHFKGEIPREAIAEVKKAEQVTQCSIDSFMIAAPAMLFTLSDSNSDPLLFIPLNDGTFYLAHQWGGDLAWYRRWLYWPVASLPNLVLTVVGVSILLAAFVPTHIIGRELSYFNFYRFAFLAWCVVFLSGMTSYFWFAMGSKFSTHAWRSRFFN
jgi:hypothetical protein